MAGREFVETEVKSVLNRVTGMPFRWSINPYRGCSHGCVFCLSGDTPILMGDGKTKRLEELRAGDQIYGTVRKGSYRRYVRTLVLAHWSAEKPSYRITLDDGTQLVASDDHRFLTDRGWKFVTGAEQGAKRRPHLTPNNKLMGTGAALRIINIEAVGVRRLFDITTGTGDFIANGVVSHNCYARRTHWFLDEDGVDRWASKIFVKVNAPEVLRRELGRPSWKREEVALGTATDPYQAIEGRYRITRRILEALLDFRTPVGIVTRCPLIVRDLDVLSELAARAGVTVCVSIATMEPGVAREIEPTVAPPAQRLRAVRMLVDRGIRTGVLLAPILPGLTDAPERLAAVIGAARDAGASFVGQRVLYLGQVTKDAFHQFLRRSHPELLPLYRRLYPGQYAPAAYQREIARVVAVEKAQVGPFQTRYLRPPAAPEQVGLF